MSTGDHLRKVQAGDPMRIPARTFNAFIDAAVATQNQQRSGTGGERAVPTTSTILIRNDSGSEQAQFAVLGIDSVIIDPDDNDKVFRQQPMLACTTPTRADHLGRFVILTEPVAAAGIARAWASGICITTLAMVDSTHTCADVTDGDPSKLTSVPSGGAEILWREMAASPVWAIVRLGGASLPSWQAQSKYMVLQLTEDADLNLTPTWDWVRAHE